MVGKPWFSGFQNTFYFFCAMLFDRVMGKNVILKTSKIPQNRLFMAKNQVQFKDFFKKVFFMFLIYLKHIIAKKNWEILKNMVSIGKKRHFFTFFAIYSKRDFRVTAFFQSLITPSITRLSTKSFRETKTNGFG